MESNIKRLYGMFNELALELQDEVTDRAMPRIQQTSKRILTQTAKAYGVTPSARTGDDKKRSRKQQKQNEKYGMSITNWRSATGLFPERSVSWTGAPYDLWYRQMFVEYGTAQHNWWSKTHFGQGRKPKPFIERAKLLIQPLAESIIRQEILRAIDKQPIRK